MNILLEGQREELSPKYDKQVFSIISSEALSKLNEKHPEVVKIPMAIRMPNEAVSILDQINRTSGLSSQ